VRTLVHGSPVPIFVRIELAHSAAQTNEVSDTEGAPKKPSGNKVGAKSRAQDASAGKMIEKRKAPHVAERYVAHHLPCASINVT
jgi:hypothetical protein